MGETQSGKTIMLVEDDSDLAEVVSIRLRDAGFEVVYCGDGESALKEVKSRLPDLMILDVFLPQVDGFSVLRGIKDYIKKTHGDLNLPVIVITGRGALMKDMFKLEGVCEFLQKPFEATELVDLVRQHVS